jgi:hypothetical protein
MLAPSLNWLIYQICVLLGLELESEVRSIELGQPLQESFQLLHPKTAVGSVDRGYADSGFAGSSDGFDLRHWVIAPLLLISQV